MRSKPARTMDNFCVGSTHIPERVIFTKSTITVMLSRHFLCKMCVSLMCYELLDHLILLCSIGLFSKYGSIPIITESSTGLVQYSSTVVYGTGLNSPLFKFHKDVVNHYLNVAEYKANCVNGVFEVCIFVTWFELGYFRLTIVLISMFADLQFRSISKLLSAGFKVFSHNYLWMPLQVFSA